MAASRPRGVREMAKFEISPKLQISRRKFLTSASLGVSGIM
ncbi:MAG: molybdopterin oxidoreductase, partial [Mesorhizobium sp.]